MCFSVAFRSPGSDGWTDETKARVHEMLYVTREGRIASAIDNLPLSDGPAFASENEFQEIAGRWPMQRLVAIWNGLPGLEPVRRFENRRIAMARIWRALP